MHAGTCNYKCTSFPLRCTLYTDHGKPRLTVSLSLFLLAILEIDSPTLFTSLKNPAPLTADVSLDLGSCVCVTGGMGEKRERERERERGRRVKESKFPQPLSMVVGGYVVVDLSIIPQKGSPGSP